MAGLSESETFRFIELVRSYPCIWDYSNPDYIDRSIARECYCSIAKAMGNGMTQDYAQRKLKSLRTQYRWNYKLMTAGNSSGNGSRDIPWKFFKPLEFLRPYMREINAAQPSIIKRPIVGQNDHSCAENSITAKIENNSDNEHLDADHSCAKNSITTKIENNSDNEHLDAEVIDRYSDAGTFQDNSDASMSLSLSVAEEGTDGEEEIYDGVENVLRQMQRPNNPAAWPNQSRSHTQQPAQDSHVRHSEDAFVVGSDGRRSACSSSRKRKQGSVDSASAQLLLGVTNKLLKREPDTRAPMTENDHFFRMMAMEVSRLPPNVQDSLRYKIHGLLNEEKQKLYE